MNPGNRGPYCRTFRCFFIMQKKPASQTKQTQAELRRQLATAHKKLKQLQREQKIEAALDAVRTRALAMHASSELREVVAVLYQELQELEFGVDQGAALVMTFTPDSNDHTQWITDASQSYTIPFFIPFTQHSIARDQINARKRGLSFLGRIYNQREKNEYFKHLFQHTQYKHLPKKVQKLILNSKNFGISIAFEKHAAIAIPSTVGTLVTADEKIILKRFAKVFEQTYTRFLDLQKAEAQAREARIEAALEKVRARSLAMQKPEEIVYVSELLRKEMAGLGVEELETSSIYMVDAKNHSAECWYAIKDIRGKRSELVSDEMTLNLKASWVGKQMLNFFRSKEKQTSIVMRGEHRKEWINYCASKSKVLKGYYGNEIPERTYHLLKFSHGYLGAASPGNISEESWNLLQRATKVFDQAYTRFLDLQKAEAQAREAQIEAALERVRARTMAMHKSEELTQTAAVLFNEFEKLGVGEVLQVTIGIYNEANRTIEFSATDWELGGANLGKTVALSMDEPNLLMPLTVAWKTGKPSFVIELTEKNLEGWLSYRNSMTGSRATSKATKGRRVITSAFFSKGHLAISSPEPKSASTIALLERFAAVFNQTYTRFLDLQKAEAQAREAQIEAALERVRSCAMAMHSSNELNDVVHELRKQMGILGQKNLETCVIHLHDELPDYIQSWAAIKPPAEEGEILESIANVPKKGLLIIEEALGNYLANKGDYVIINQDEKLKQWFSFLERESPIGFTKLAESVNGNVEELRAYWSFADFSGGSLLMVTRDEPDEPTRALLRRFSNVFGLAYRRFADLKHAEAQAREAQIETALERVRSKTIAMHSSREVGESVATLFDELSAMKLLGSTDRCGIGIMQPHEIMELWTAEKTEGGKTDLTIGFLDMKPHPMLRAAYKGWVDKKEVNQYILVGEDKLNYYQAMQNQAQYKIKKDYYTGTEKIVHTDFYFNEGVLYVFSQNEFNEESVAVFIRFANVFGQTYRRYLDLKKAEAQAREAQIEAALERVRSRSLAMHRSDELEQVAATLFEAVVGLGIAMDGALLFVFNRENKNIGLWIATVQLTKPVFIDLPYEDTLKDNEVFIDYWNTIASGGQLLNRVYPEKAKNDYFRYVQRHNSSKIPDQLKQLQIELPDWNLSFVAEKNTILGLDSWSGHQFTEADLNTLRKFARTFEQAYTRFLDLQRAEAQAREAQIEAALEKVRNRTLAMQTSEELADAAYVLFEQLNILGVTHERINIGIVNETQQTIDFWVTEQGGEKLSTKFSGRITEPTTLSKAYEAWKRGEKSLMIDLKGEDLKRWLKYMKEEIKIPFNNAFLHDRRVQTAGFFSKGMLVVTSPEPLQEEALYLLEKFAGVFDLTYTRFSDLKIAEAHARQSQLDLKAIKDAKQKAEAALTELKATQKQLIQAEKMASLGELTAGIAHEIQNPLNFVNNFSEVSTELLDEMKAELVTGNLQPATEIAEDVKQNLEKILYHGKRADAIVKSMLQHSRSSSGKKELTDINALCDEYLRLAYHGYRAKDKSFNSKFESQLDPSLPKVNVVAQDIGRVILNLINNAFYAVSEESKVESQKSGASYEPTVTVSTRNLGDKIEISVKDNGPGIPESIKEKIFQPFFTTKPTGQGTGLGLSLSYDIIKAHGGQLEVISSEGSGSTFRIELPTLV